MSDAVGLVYFGPDGALYAVVAPATGNGGLPVQFAGGGGTGNVNIVQVGSNAVATAGVNGALGVGGTSAAGATDDGSNPLKIGGVYNSAFPTLLTGQRGTAQLTPNSNLGVSIAAGNGSTPTYVAVGAFTDGFGGANNLLFVGSRTLLVGTAGQLYSARDLTNTAAAGTGTMAVAQAPSSAAGAAIAPNANAALGASLIGKAAAGNVYGWNICTTSVSGYVMLFDSATVPADGAVTPKKVYTVAANTAIELDYGIPLKMANGAVLVFSTTGPYNKTASATAFIEMDVV